MFWNILQDHRLFKLREWADAIESRIMHIEKNLTDLQDLLQKMLYALESHLNEDINNDAHIGKPPTKRMVMKKCVSVQKKT